jgi:AcrR family transcriptional regulator
MQKPTQSRYARGIANPDPVKLAALRALLESDPTLGKADVARRVGLSRASVGYYVRSIAADVARAREEAATRRVLSHVDLVERVAGVASDVREEIARVRRSGGKNASALFAGFRTLLAAERLLAELVGEIAPPAQNTYVLQVAAMLDRPVAASALSTTARTALGMVQNGASG